MNRTFLTVLGDSFPRLNKHYTSRSRPIPSRAPTFELFANAIKVRDSSSTRELSSYLGVRLRIDPVNSELAGSKL